LQLRYYHPKRLYFVFVFLLSVYLLIKRKASFLGIKPLSPQGLHQSIVYLGASFIKLAQVLATRSDFFDQAYLNELKNLHDALPQMDEKAFSKVYEKNFDVNSFAHFEKEPIACASIGQVHVAYDEQGNKLAVKLRRDGIYQQVSADIRIISFFNTLFRPLFSHYTKNSIEAVISEFSKMVLQEVSFSQELQNLQKFSSVYQNSGVIFPKPIVSLCSDDVLVMSFEEGFRFDDKQSIYEHAIDFNHIITKLVHFYTDQMLINGYFHADPHPGNLLVNTKGELIFLDFGMVKTVPNQTRVAIIELIKAANEQDYDAYISANKKLGTVAYEAPTAELAEFTARMFEIFSNDNLGSESMQQLAFEVLETTRNLPFKLPSDAIYILRVSAIIEGLGTTYIENFNGIKDILPILQENIPRALGAKESLVETLVDELKDLPMFMRDVKSMVRKASYDELQVELSSEQLGWLKKELKGEVKHHLLSITLLLGSLFVMSVNSEYVALAAGMFAWGVIRIIYR
jgi:ubiquinone biosynthesis protein